MLSNAKHLAYAVITRTRSFGYRLRMTLPRMLQAKKGLRAAE